MSFDFDPDQFMSQTVDQPLETERTLVPEGEYRLRIGDFTSEAFETFEFTYKKGPNKGEDGKMVNFTCPVIVDDDKVRAALKTEEPRVYHRCTLDFDSDGNLAWGPNRNIDLGKLRHATNQNNPGPWSVSMLRNSPPFMGKIQHRTGKRKDGSPFKIAEIVRFAPIR